MLTGTHLASEAIGNGTDASPLDCTGLPDPKEARRQYLIAEIRDFIATRCQRPDDYMKPKEIGAAKDRPFLLLRSMLDGIAHYYRENPGARVLLGVFVADTIFSDNEQGCSTVSAARIAKLLSCSDKSVLRAREFLAENGLMCREKHPGLDDHHWPVVNRAMAGRGTSTTWWLDATSEPPAKRGRPEKPRTPDVATLSKNPQTPTVLPFEKTPDSKLENPGHHVSDEFSIEFTEEKRGRALTRFQTNGQVQMMGALNPDAAARRAYATRNISISESGKVTIGEEFRAQLRSEGFAESMIDTGLLNACRYIDGGNPEKWLKTVRTACGWARRDEGKAAVVPRRPGIVRNGRPSM